MYDVIVIGNGPVGVTAAVYTKRANLNTLVIGKDGGSLEKAEKIQNYYGFENITGTALVKLGIEQVKSLGVEYKKEEVIAIEKNENVFKVVTNINEYEAIAIVIATGTVRNKVNIDGVNQFEGKGISYCAICDAFFFKGKDVAVLGNGKFAVHEVNDLLPVVKTVTMLTNGKEKLSFRDERVNVLDKKIKRISGESRLEKVEFEDNTSLPVSAVFIAEGTASSVDFAKRMGAEIADNNIVVDSKYMTSIPGMFAAGDCIGGLLQVSKAVSDGENAGIYVIDYVRKNK